MKLPINVKYMTVNSIKSATNPSAVNRPFGLFKKRPVFPKTPRMNERTIHQPT